MNKRKISVICAAISGAAAGGLAAAGVCNRRNKKALLKRDKFKQYYHLLNQWFAMKQRKESIEPYFIEKGYRKIAIYGLGELGNRLYEELKDSAIEVKYAIDKHADSIYTDLEIRSPDEKWESADAVVVTAVYDFKEIHKKIAKKIDCPVISLEEVIYESI